MGQVETLRERAAGAKFQQDVVDALASDAALGAWLNEAPETPNTAYLRARAASDAGDAERAAKNWERFFALQQLRDPFHLLAYSRVLCDCGRWEEAIMQLRRALDQRPRYAFYPRAEKLIRRVAAESSTHLRECRAAVLGSSTTSLLITVLQACF